MQQRPSPTRINLISTKRRIRTARKGYGILKKKQEALVLEFMKLLKQSGKSRDYLNAVMQRSYKVVITASTYVGNFELEDVAYNVKETESVIMSVRNIMGVRIPEAMREGKKNSVNFNLISTSIAVEDINNSFNEAVDAVVDIAKREQGLRRLVIEVEKTKRRVNALDYILIPSFNAQSKYISMRLEEIDRDMFSALKHVKKSLAKAE